MKSLLAVLLVLAAVAGVGCATRPESLASRDLLSMQVEEAVRLFQMRDPTIQTYFDTSYAYAVLPKVTKGAVFLGGAYGRGEVFARGVKVGYCSMSQASMGFSFGGQYFREIIFFQDKAAFDRFTMEDFTPSSSSPTRDSWSTPPSAARSSNTSPPSSCTTNRPPSFPEGRFGAMLCAAGHAGLSAQGKGDPPLADVARTTFSCL